MTGQSDPSDGRVRPPVALALAATGFFALAIFGLGMTSLVLNADVIAVKGLGPLPGVFGMLLALAAFAGVLWPVMRSARPRYRAAVVAAVAVYLGELLGIVIGAFVGGAGPARAFAAAAGVATSWFGVVIAVAALAAAWAGIALVRTRAARPRWPWEDEYDE